MRFLRDGYEICDFGCEIASRLAPGRAGGVHRRCFGVLPIVSSSQLPQSPPTDSRVETVSRGTMRESRTMIGKAVVRVASLLVVLLLAIGPYSVSAGASYFFDHSSEHTHVQVDQAGCADVCTGDYDAAADESEPSHSSSAFTDGTCDPLCVGSLLFSPNSGVGFVTTVSKHGAALTERLYGDEWASLHRPPNA